jgi:peptide/nickel transport system permease protein
VTAKDSPARRAPSRLAPLYRFTRAYVARPSGLLGVVVLLGFTVLALSAPLFIHPSDLSVVQATGPSMAPPTSH